MCFVKTHQYTLCPPGHRRVTLRKKCHLRPRIFGIPLWASSCPRLDISNEDVDTRCPSCARKKREEEERLQKRKRQDQALLEWQRIRQANAATVAAKNKATGQGSTGGSYQSHSLECRADLPNTKPQQPVPQNAGHSRVPQVLPSILEPPADLASKHPIQSELISPVSQTPKGAENPGVESIHSVDRPEAEMNESSRTGREQTQSPVQALYPALRNRGFGVAGTSRFRNSLFFPTSATFSDQPSEGYFPEWRVRYDATKNTLTSLAEEPEPTTWGRIWRGTDGVRSRLAAAELDDSDSNTKAIKHQG